MTETKPVILIVDDQPDLVEGIKLILEQEEYEVWTASNGQVALNKLEAVFTKTPGLNGETSSKILPDLILADIMMPVMDGHELYERVRANPYLNHIPFTFLTAKVDASDVRKGKAMGADDYLTKPCLPDDLLASVEGKLKRNQQRREIQSQFTEDLDKMPAGGVVVLIALVGIIGFVVVATALTTWWLIS